MENNNENDFVQRDGVFGVPIGPIFEADIVNDDDDLEGLGIIMGTSPESLSDLLAKKFPDDIWLVDGLIPTNGITILSAQPGSYKTWLLLDIALCVASGSKVFGEFSTKPTGVLVIDEENGERLLQQRLNMLCAESNLSIHFLPDAGFMLSDDTVIETIDYCKLYDIGFVTFDSLVRIHDGNENDAKEMAAVFRRLREFTKEDITVLLTHHNRKPGSGENPAHEMRGSSDILAALDCHLALSRTESDRLVLKQTKVRLAPELPPIELQVVSENDQLEIQYTGNGKPSETKREMTRQSVLGLLSMHGSLNQRKLLDLLERMNSKVNARTLRTILERMLDNGEITKSQGERNAIIYRLTPPEANMDE